MRVAFAVTVALVLAVLTAGRGGEGEDGPRGARAVTAFVPALRADLAATPGARVWLRTLTARTALLALLRRQEGLWTERLARPAAASKRALDRTSREFAALFDEGDPDASGTELASHTAATTTAIRTQATRSRPFAKEIVAASASAHDLGRALAVRVARQQPDKFPAN